jgi:hypothetical protein
VQAQQVTVKVPVASAEGVDLEAFITIFHRWIQETRLPGVLLIDVADYRHVPDGPGVMLIADGAHYGMDEGDGGLGLLYARKRDPIGDAGDKLAQALAAALAACVAIEKEPSLDGRVRFPADELLIEVRSRLVATNTDETFAAFEPAWRELFARLYDGAEVTIERLHADPRAPFGVRVRASTSPGPVALLAHLA